MGYSARGLKESDMTKHACMFHVHRKQASFSLPDLFRVPKGRFKQVLIKEGRECRNKGRAIKKQFVVVVQWLSGNQLFAAE